jgi:hypothetical protein
MSMAVNKKATTYFTTISTWLITVASLLRLLRRNIALDQVLNRFERAGGFINSANVAGKVCAAYRSAAWPIALAVDIAVSAKMRGSLLRQHLID